MGRNIADHVSNHNQDMVPNLRRYPLLPTVQSKRASKAPWYGVKGSVDANRWGHVIFNSNNLSKGCDSKLNNIPQPLDTYIWIIKYTAHSGKKYTLKGFVTLIR